MDTFWVEGHPNTDHRPRLGRRGAYMNPDYTNWVETIGWAAKMSGVKWYDGEVALVIKAYTKSHKKQDFDNLAKPVAEGLQSIAFFDDRQVYVAHISKYPPHPVRGEGIHVMILNTKAEISLSEMEARFLAMLSTSEWTSTKEIGYHLWSDEENASGVRNLVSRLRKKGYHIESAAPRRKGYYRLVTDP